MTIASQHALLPRLPQADDPSMAKLRTGVGVAGISGTSGGAVFVQRRDGSVVVRERAVGGSAPTPSQLQARQLMARASRAWQALTDDEQRSWLEWARQADPFAGAPQAVNAYRALAVRWLAAQGSLGEPPRLPPTSPFGGDALSLRVEPAPGALRLVADRANAPGVLTELLAASVRSALAEPRDRDYRILARVGFSHPGQVALAGARPGRWATAARFLRAETGQAGPVLRLGVVRVESG